jgi:hypothetical protein
VGKRVKTPLAMIAADSAAAGSAEWKMQICEMQQGVIDATAAKGEVSDNLFAMLPIVGKKI